MKTMLHVALFSMLLLFPIFSFSLYAQGEGQPKARTLGSPFSLCELKIESPLPDQIIWASRFQLFNLNFSNLEVQLKGEDIPNRNSVNPTNEVFINLPNPTGTFDSYRILRNTTMHPELAAKFPEIRTYDVVGVQDKSLRGKIDITPQGFHAMILDLALGTFFVDTIALNRTDL
jgi:hypothetical protein